MSFLDLASGACSSRCFRSLFIEARFCVESEDPCVHAGSFLFRFLRTGCESFRSEARMMQEVMRAQASVSEQPIDGHIGPELNIKPSQAVAELACMILAVELIEWAVPLAGNNAKAYGGLALMIALLMAVCFLKDGLSPKRLGIRIDNFLPALGDLLPFLMVFVLAMVSIGLVCGSIRLADRFWSMLAVVPPWALLQQYMLLAFANHRFRVLLGGDGATI